MTSKKASLDGTPDQAQSRRNRGKTVRRSLVEASQAQDAALLARELRTSQTQQELAAGGVINALPSPPSGQHSHPPVSNRPPSTTIDALEREFQKKKQKELEQARSVSSSSADTNGTGPRRTGEKVGRNDPCPCGSGKKYKKCHGADA